MNKTTVLSVVLAVWTGYFPILFNEKRERLSVFLFLETQDSQLLGEIGLESGLLFT